MSFRLTPQGKLHISENDVEAACLAIADRRGWWHVRLHAGTFRTWDGQRVIKGVKKGTPDYLLAHPVYPAFFLETKAPGRKLSPEQEAEIWTLMAHFHLETAVMSSPEEFAEWIQAHELGP